VAEGPAIGADQPPPRSRRRERDGRGKRRASRVCRKIPWIGVRPVLQLLS